METAQRLEQMQLFDTMSARDRQHWADRFTRERYLRDQVVTAQGERVNAFYIVDKGELRALTSGDAVPVAHFYPGDHFGDISLLSNETQYANIEAVEDVELLVLDARDFYELVEAFPDIRERLLIWGRQRRASGQMHFSWQRPEEVTLLYSKKHWIAFVRRLPLPGVVSVLGLVSAVVYVEALLTTLPPVFFMVLAGALLAFAVLILLYQFFDWRNDYYVVTTERVLHVERVLLIREERDEAPIEQVQDVQVSQKSVLANVLGFGNVLIQTAAATQKILFADIPNPEMVRYAIFTPVRYRHETDREETEASIRQRLAERLNIPLSPDGQVEEEEEVSESRLTPEEETETPTSPADAASPLDVLERAGAWLERQFTFDTWIITDAGNTITWRKTRWILLKVSILPTLVALVAITALIWSLVQGIGFPWLPLVLFVLFLIGFGWWLYVYWDWQNDIYRVSGNRLIDLKRRPLFMEELRRETTLDRVENVNLTIPGPIAQVLNYGTVIIETAGEVGAFNFVHVHDPRAVQTEIFNRRERFLQKQREEERRRRETELAEWFRIYEELRQRPRPS